MPGGPDYIDKTEWEDFLTNRLLGVLTKVDKNLESNSAKDAASYNGAAAAALHDSIFSVNNPGHLFKLKWLAVLNPNSEEQASVRS